MLLLHRCASSCRAVHGAALHVWLSCACLFAGVVHPTCLTVQLQHLDVMQQLVGMC